MEPENIVVDADVIKLDQGLHRTENVHGDGGLDMEKREERKGLR